MDRLAHMQATEAISLGRKSAVAVAGLGVCFNLPGIV